MDVWPTTQTGFIDAYSAAAADSTGYMGCWMDASTRLLNGTTFTTSSMTPTSCQANCAAQGYQYAGVEAKNQCYCSHQIRTGTQRLGEDRCSYACVGDATQKCGGNWAVNVYTSAKGATTPSSSVSASASASKSASSSAASSTPSSAAIEGYKGCYGLGSAVSGAQASSTGSNQMTTGFCRRFCRVQGFSAAILQNGNSKSCPMPYTFWFRADVIRLLLFYSSQSRYQAARFCLYSNLFRRW
jgi:glucan endo-1,3-alpha-glucosidase